MAVDTLFFEDRFLGGASYSPDGKQLLLTASPEAFDGIGKNCGNHPIANDFDSQAFIMDLATRKIDPITKEFNPSVNFLQWNKGDGCIYFSTNDEDCRNIYRYSPKDRKFEKLNLRLMSPVHLPCQKTIRRWLLISDRDATMQELLMYTT